MSDTQSFFDREAAGWSERYLRDPRFRRRFEKITSVIARHLPKPPFTALDVGCGSGVFSRWLASIGAEVIAIDPSKEMIAEAEHITSNAITFLVGDLQSYSTTSRFDLVVALSMLEYIDRAETALTRLTELASSTLVVSVPNRRGFVRRFERFAIRVARVTRGLLFSGRGQYLSHQRHQWTPNELDRMLAERGFERIESTFVGTGFGTPAILLPLFERGWWAGMYCAVYERA